MQPGYRASRHGDGCDAGLRPPGAATTARTLPPIATAASSTASVRWSTTLSAGRPLLPGSADPPCRPGLARGLGLRGHVAIAAASVELRQADPASRMEDAMSDPATYRADLVSEIPARRRA
jgi:hypothetical protein